MAQSWWEIQVLCEPILEDLVSLRLEKFGCRGFSSEVPNLKEAPAWGNQAIRPDQYLVKGYVPQSQIQILDLGALALALKQDAMAVDLPPPEVSWKRIHEEDWSTSWKQHWEAEEIGDRFLICPAWLEPDPTDRLVMILDPGVAFGTGAHPTTQLCLESLEMRFSVPETDRKLTIADMGCGSGILSIGAIQLGASQVYAMDTDPLAVKSTLANRDLNQISAEQIAVSQNSADKLLELAYSGVQFDGIVCNILADIIVDMIPTFSAVAEPHTWGILSGILTTQAQMIASKLEENGWIVATLWKRKEWCCFNVRRC